MRQIVVSVALLTVEINSFPYVSLSSYNIPESDRVGCQEGRLSPDRKEDISVQ